MANINCSRDNRAFDLFLEIKKYRCMNQIVILWLASVIGYMLLSGRVRRKEESLVIQDVLQKHLKRKVHPDILFSYSEKTSPTTQNLLKVHSRLTFL